MASNGAGSSGARSAEYRADSDSTTVATSPSQHRGRTACQRGQRAVLIHRRGSARARPRERGRFRERAGAREGLGQGKAGAALARSQGSASARSRLFGLRSGVSPRGSEMDSSRGKRFWVSPRAVSQAAAEPESESQTDPLRETRRIAPVHTGGAAWLQQRNISDRVGHPVEPYGQRAPFNGAPNPNQTTPPLRIYAADPAPHPNQPIPLPRCPFPGIPGPFTNQDWGNGTPVPVVLS